MAKNNCATAPKSFHLFNSRGQFSSEMEISLERNPDQCTMPRSDLSNQQWPGRQGHITTEMTKVPNSRASEWKKDVFRGVHIIVKEDTPKLSVRGQFFKNKETPQMRPWSSLYFESINGTQNSDWQRHYQHFSSIQLRRSSACELAWESQQSVIPRKAANSLAKGSRMLKSQRSMRQERKSVTFYPREL